MSTDSQNQNYTYEIIEIVISGVSLICCFFMCYVYGKQASLKMFSYATQFYILTGALLFTTLDFIYNCYYLDALITECQSTAQVDFQSSMCQITSYISTYGIMNMICWQHVLISITRQAVLKRKAEQFSGHIYLITYAFFAPLLYTIIPQLSNESIYGSFDNVCWLQYNFTHNYTSPIKCNDHERNENEFRLLKGSEETYFYANYNDIITFSILFYFLPIIIQCGYQLREIRRIRKDITKSLLNKEECLNASHIEAINSLMIIPIYFLLIVIVPLILFIREYWVDVPKVNQWVFQVLKGMLSATSLVLLFAFSRNKYLRIMVKATIMDKIFTKKGEVNPYQDEVIDLFQGIKQL